MDDLTGTLSRVAAALERARTGPPPPPADLLSALADLRELRDELAGWEPDLVTTARAAGVSWAELAPALGVTSRQAAERRYLRLHPSGADDRRTGEERVRDERARRAGDRAVATWARANSGTLRTLAGRVSALRDLPAEAQQRVGDVRGALADDDPARLVQPLTDAEAHLPADQAGLADEVRSVTAEVDRLRRDARTPAR